MGRMGDVGGIAKGMRETKARKQARMHERKRERDIWGQNPGMEEEIRKPKTEHRKPVRFSTLYRLRLPFLRWWWFTGPRFGIVIPPLPVMLVTFTLLLQERNTHTHMRIQPKESSIHQFPLHPSIHSSFVFLFLLMDSAFGFAPVGRYSEGGPSWGFFWSSCPSKDDGDDDDDDDDDDSRNRKRERRAKG